MSTIHLVLICVWLAVAGHGQTQLVARFWKPSPQVEAQRGIEDYDPAFGLTFEQLKPRLDKFAKRLKSTPNARVHIIVYGGRVGPEREADARGKCIKGYLVKKHKIKPARITVVNGGYREEVDTELYAILPHQPDPIATPVVDPSSVQITSSTVQKESKCTNTRLHH